MIKPANALHWCNADEYAAKGHTHLRIHGTKIKQNQMLIRNRDKIQVMCPRLKATEPHNKFTNLVVGQKSKLPEGSTDTVRPQAYHSPRIKFIFIISVLGKICKFPFFVEEIR